MRKDAQEALLGGGALEKPTPTPAMKAASNMAAYTHPSELNITSHHMCVPWATSGRSGERGVLR